MKIAVINYSGSVGKTLVASYVLAPRLEGAKFYAVETINQSASDLGIENVNTFKGDDFSKLIEDVVFEDAGIIDIGASNVEPFLSAMSRFDNGANEFDKYIIPVISDGKAIEESIKTAHALKMSGVSSEKIIFVPNRMKSGEDVKNTLSQIYNFVKQTKVGSIKEDSTIYNSEVFEYLAYHKMSFEQLTAEDPEEFKSKAKQCVNAEERKSLARRYTYMKQAIPVKINLNKSYASIMGQ